MWSGLSMHEAVETLINEVIERCAQEAAQEACLADTCDESSCNALLAAAGRIRSLATTEKP